MAKGKKKQELTYAQEFASKGGKARAQKLTPEQRKKIARKAARALWAKRKREEERQKGVLKHFPGFTGDFLGFAKVRV